MALPRFAPSLLVVAAIGCAAELPTPPVAVGPEQGFDGSIDPLHATDDGTLFITHSVPDGSLGTRTSLHRVTLGEGGSEQLATGEVRHARVTDGALVVVVTDDIIEGGNTRLVTIPLDGSAVTEVALADATVATASDGVTTYAIESNNEIELRTRIVTLPTESQPSRVVLESTQPTDRQLFVDGGHLYWNSALRIATDGSELEPTPLYRSREADVPVFEGSFEQEQIWTLGIVGGEPYVMRRITSFFATGGTYSDGEPRGGTGFGGGELYTVGPSAPNDVLHSNEARLLRNGDVRTAWMQDGAILAQLRDHSIVDIDLARGIATPLAETSHALESYTRLVRTQTAIYYGAGAIHVIDLTTP